MAALRYLRLGVARVCVRLARRPANAPLRPAAVGAAAAATHCAGRRAAPLLLVRLPLLENRCHSAQPHARTPAGGRVAAAAGANLIWPLSLFH
jgi:hypothetical protein